MAKRRNDPPAQSFYRGLRVTITQHPDREVAYLNVAAKPPTAGWDEWDLLYPAIQVPLRQISDYRQVLGLAIEALTALVRHDEEYR